MRSFWKIHFINPPEAQDQIVELRIYRQENNGDKLPKLRIWVNRKKEDILPLPSNAHPSVPVPILERYVELTLDSCAGADCEQKVESL